MTTTTIPHLDAAPTGRTTRPHPPRGLLHDAWVIARRGMVHLRRQPELLSDSIGHPVMFVLMFSYVLGGAISVPGGGEYREFLMGGVFAQTAVFSAFFGALALASDRKNQAVHRFRSLPLAGGAVLTGHALTNLLKAVVSVTVASLVGLAVGWRIDSGPLDAAGGFLLLLAFTFAMTWVGILVGSAVATPEGVSGIAFVVLFPATFIASTFVPTDTMPGLVRTLAEWNPTTTLADALRIQFGNPHVAAAAGDSWPLTHPTAYTAVWIVGIVAVCAPLAIRTYRRSLDR